MPLTARLAWRPNLPSGDSSPLRVKKPSSTYTCPLSGLSVDTAGHGR
jgi:hypothetical protein